MKQLLDSIANLGISFKVFIKGIIISGKNVNLINVLN